MESKKSGEPQLFSTGKEKKEEMKEKKLVHVIDHQKTTTTTITPSVKKSKIAQEQNVRIMEEVNEEMEEVLDKNKKAEKEYDEDVRKAITVVDEVGKPRQPLRNQPKALPVHVADILSESPRFSIENDRTSSSSSPSYAFVESTNKTTNQHSSNDNRKRGRFKTITKTITIVSNDTEEDHDKAGQQVDKETERRVVNQAEGSNLTNVDLTARTTMSETQMGKWEEKKKGTLGNRVMEKVEVKESGGLKKHHGNAITTTPKSLPPSLPPILSIPSGGALSNHTKQHQRHRTKTITKTITIVTNETDDDEGGMDDGSKTQPTLPALLTIPFYTGWKEGGGGSSQAQDINGTAVVSMKKEADESGGWKYTIGKSSAVLRAAQQNVYSQQLQNQSIAINFSNYSDFNSSKEVARPKCDPTCGGAPGWHYHDCHCYLLVVRSEGMNFTQAQVNCRIAGGPSANLASIHSAEENEFLAAITKHVPPLVIDERPKESRLAEGGWTGMTRSPPPPGAVNGTWKCQWNDGSAVDYGGTHCSRPGVGQHPWSDPQYENSLRGGGCVALGSHGTPSGRYAQWSDYPCHRLFRGAFCKKNSILDSQKTQQLTTALPKLQASTKLPAALSLPQVDNKTALQQSLEAKCNWYYRDGFCYRLIVQEKGVNRSQAHAMCRTLNADLPSVHSAEENEFLANISAQVPKTVLLCHYPQCSDVAEQLPQNHVAQGYWLGMIRKKDKASGRFTCAWSDNSTVDYPGKECPQGASNAYPWSPSSPDHFLEAEECIHHYPFHSSYFKLWNDWQCRFKLMGVMCKKPCTDPCQA